VSKKSQDALAESVKASNKKKAKDRRRKKSRSKSKH